MHILRSFIKVILLLCLFIDMPLLAGTELSGAIFMPAVRKERRTFRGRIYRNRLATNETLQKNQANLSSSFIDVVVILLPHADTIRAEPLKSIKIIQKQATFIPRVTPVTPGTIVEFINEDVFFHNVFSITPGDKFNIGRKPTGEVEFKSFEKPGEVKLFCDIHAQMNATVICVDTPYFTRVLPTGRYVIRDIEPGMYTIQVYHPELLNIEETIEIGINEKIVRNFTLNQ